ncbi:MAG: AAA family ATPase [Hyphomonadaceae bacterium JAD_PAG50586_4]|nr:MAG: AAA family ATPase [Hyphomonadaceae bacterium JAD_PAG50586_4]
MARGYLFSDIDGSTQKWERSGAAMQAAMQRHDRIFVETIRAHGGFIHDQAGDGVFAIFEAGNPIACALALQLALEREPWPGLGDLRVRLGVHVGPDAASSDPSSISPNIAERIAINRTARIASSAWGGQIVVSAEAKAAFDGPNECRWLDLGAVYLKGVDTPMRLYGLAHPQLKQSVFAPLRLQEAAHANLPAPSAPLLGRAEDMARLLAAMRSGQQLINLIGPAGVGKTRLVQEAARTIGEIEPVLYVPIEAAGVDLMRLLVRALGVDLSGEGDLVCALSEALGGAAKRVIVLDNVERAVGQDLAALMILAQTRRDLVIVCVSRWPLEGPFQRLRLGGLAMPEPGRDGVVASAAYQLFEREARRAGGAIALDEEGAAQFVRLNAAVAGSPLALQLSATWLRYLTLEAVVKRLTAPGGHELSAIFADTWAALDADLRRALGALSVFCAPFSPASAEAIAGVGPNTLMALEDRGLLERAADRQFELHPLICDFARGKAQAAAAEARTAHAAHFLSPQSLAPRVRGEASTPIGEVQAAWRFARQSWSTAALKNVGERLFYWCAFAGLFAEGASMFEADCANVISAYEGALRANCLVHANQGDLAQSLALAASACDDATTRAHGLHALANLAHARGDYAEAQTHYQAALSLRQDGGDQMGVHYTSMSLAALALAQGQVDRAAGHLVDASAHAFEHSIAMIHVHFFAGEVALAQARHADADFNFARALDMDALVEHPPFRTRLLLRMGSLRARGKADAARLAFDEAAALAHARGDVRGAAFGAVELGLVALDAGDFERARAEILAAVRTGLELRSKPIVARALQGLMQVETALGDLDAATRLRQVLGGAALDDLDAGFVQAAGAKSGDAHLVERAHAHVLEKGARALLRL